MSARLRRTMLLLGTIILVIQTAFMPIGILSAETTMDTDEHEQQVEIPPEKNSLEKDLAEDPRFFFTKSQWQGMAGDPINVTLSSDQEVSEAQVILPEEATIIKEQLPEGISVEEGAQPNEWSVHSKRARTMFDLPLVFNKAGSYELSVEETTTHVEISEQEETSEETPFEETEFFDDNLSENKQEQQINEKNQIISEVDKKAFASNDFNTTVTPENFLNYFGLSGSASVNGNIVTLTEARNSQSGSLYLKNKIDSTYPFILTGKVFLGHNSNSADGIGFGFHKDEPDSIGLTGSGFGLAGLTDVFGFKLDTYYNGTNSRPFRPDPINTGAFGSFVYMDGEWFTSYTGNDAPARSITRPSGLWRDIKIMLSEQTILRIEYEDMVWEKEMPISLNDSSLSFLVSASTGAVNALQQFEFESFKYSRENTTIVVNYIDDSGNNISESKVIDGLVGDEYQTEPKAIPGFTLKDIPDNAFGIFKEEEQVVNYIYIKDIIEPVDPLDPEVEVEPENKPDIPEDQGLLSIDFVSSFRFGSQSISVHDQTYYAQPQRLLDEDGSVNENEERPNYVQISDRRSESERNGWELAVTQKEQFKGEENQVLNGASISLSNQQVVSAQGGTAPGLQSVPCELIPGNRRTLLKAQGNEGVGTWIYRFGDAETAKESVALNVPKGANPEATSYSTTLTWELSAVPNN